MGNNIDNDICKTLNKEEHFTNEETFHTYIEQKRKDNNEPFHLPYSFKKIISVSSVDIDGFPAYILNKRISNQKAILYIHGGTFIENPTDYHYMFIEKLILNTNACVFLPIYPLLPNYTFVDTYKMILKVYNFMQKYYFNEISIMGDSCGGGIALAFSADVIARGIKPFDHTILISPLLDLRMNNEELCKYEEKEHFFSKKRITMLGELWRNGVDMSDYLLSPINVPLTGIKDITIIVGTEEMFFPDCEGFYRRAVFEGYPINYLKFPQKKHIFPFYPVKESAEANQAIYNIINYKVPHFNVRWATDDDIDEVERMLDEANMDYPLFDNRVSKPFINLVVKENDKIIAGLCSCFTCFSIVYVQSIVVDPNYRQLGIGHKLMQQMEYIAKTKGANIIRLDAFNFQGKEFFEEIGYECVGSYNHPTDNFQEFFFIKSI